MSKYYKVDDVSRAIIELPDAENGYSSSYDKAEILNALEDIPTIEVSEDCISKEWLIRDLNDYAEIHGTCTYEKIDFFKRLVENAPSVVPSCQKNRQVERAEEIKG